MLAGAASRPTLPSCEPPPPPAWKCGGVASPGWYRSNQENQDGKRNVSVEARTDQTRDSTHRARIAERKRCSRKFSKTSTHDYLDYKYTSADDMMKACREALHQRAHVRPHRARSAHAAPGCLGGVQRSGDPASSSLCARTLRLEHESGEFRDYSFDLPAIPEKGRPLDKAILGCMTTSTGYMPRDLLQAPREDANEVDKRDDSHVQAPRRVAKGPTWAAGGQRMEQQPQQQPKPRPAADVLCSRCASGGPSVRGRAFFPATRTD